MHRSSRVLGLALVGALVGVLGGPAAEAAPVSFLVPDGWKTEQPANKMRKHQFLLPKAEGDAAETRVIVFHFGAHGGGKLQDNVVRWGKQIARGEGDPAKVLIRRTCNGVDVAIHDQQGTYAPPSFRPGAPKKAPQPGTRLINVYVPTSEGIYFVRLVGPQKTVAAQHKAFLEFLGTMSLSEGVKALPLPKFEEGPTSQPEGPGSRPTSRPTSRPSGR
jgi:hypothetical protein